MASVTTAAAMAMAMAAATAVTAVANVTTVVAGSADAGGDVALVTALVLLHVDGHVSNYGHLDGFNNGDWDVDSLDDGVGLLNGDVLDVVDVVGDWDGDGLVDEDADGVVILALAAPFAVPLHEATPRGGQGHAHR